MPVVVCVRADGRKLPPRRPPVPLVPSTMVCADQLGAMPPDTVSAEGKSSSTFFRPWLPVGVTLLSNVSSAFSGG